MAGCRRSYYPELELDAFICPDSPTLLQMVKPGRMIGSYHQPLEDLPILHELLRVSSHLISDDIRLLGHD